MLKVRQTFSSFELAQDRGKGNNMIEDDRAMSDDLKTRVLVQDHDDAMRDIDGVVSTAFPFLRLVLSRRAMQRPLVGVACLTSSNVPTRYLERAIEASSVPKVPP